MEKGIVILDANKKHGQQLSAILNEQQYQTTQIRSIRNLERYLKESDCCVIMLDLDSIPVDNHLIKRLKRIKPAIRIIGLSSRSFHPELQEAMTSQIFACINKPIDEDELIFLVNSLYPQSNT